MNSFSSSHCCPAVHPEIRRELLWPRWGSLLNPLIEKTEEWNRPGCGGVGAFTPPPPPMEGQKATLHSFSSHRPLTPSPTRSLPSSSDPRRSCRDDVTRTVSRKHQSLKMLSLVLSRWIPYLGCAQSVNGGVVQSLVKRIARRGVRGVL